MEEKVYEMIRVQCGEHEGESYRFKATETELQKVKDFFWSKFEDDNIDFGDVSDEKIFTADDLIKLFTRYL